MYYTITNSLSVKTKQIDHRLSKHYIYEVTVVKLDLVLIRFLSKRLTNVMDSTSLYIFCFGKTVLWELKNSLAICFVCMLFFFIIWIIL